MIEPASEEAKCVTLGNCPLFLLVASDSIECGGPSLNWLCQTHQKPFLIKNLLNSYRAGAHCTLITLDISALYGVDVGPGAGCFFVISIGQLVWRFIHLQQENQKIIHSIYN